MTDTGGSLRWLGSPLSDLIALKDEQPCDVAIIGSGYGGSIAAHYLAEQFGDALRIVMLERGNEYLPGGFPADATELPAHVRFSGGTNSTGLFELHGGPDLNSVTGNGLGGGSLINAGVMIRPDASFYERLPVAIGAEDLEVHFERCIELFGARPTNPLPQKFHALKSLSPTTTAPCDVTISGADHGDLSACNHCGNCVTGCNHGSKASLDVTVLAEAKRHNDNFRIYTGADVRELVRHGEQDWEIIVEHTDEHVKGTLSETCRVRSRHVIVAAGTFGSVSLLARSRQNLSLSKRLGRGISGNGDTMMVAYDTRQTVNMIATSATASTPGVGPGPVITGMVDLREDQGILIEEMSVPFPLKTLFEETYSTLATLHGLEQVDTSRHATGQSFVDPLAVSVDAMRCTAIYAAMGDDGAEGEIGLEDGSLVHWPSVRHHPLFTNQSRLISALHESSGTGGVVIDNPLWRPVPPGLEYLTRGKRGPLLTVHPLGGCGMGTDTGTGVVNANGQVFRDDLPSEAVYEDLLVLDGSILPCAVGSNPALTIAALARRALSGLCVASENRETAGSQERPCWTFGRGYGGASLPPRPRYREIQEEHDKPETTFRISERLSGEITVNGRARILELTIVSLPVSAGHLVDGASAGFTLATGSLARLYDPDQYRRLMLEDVGSDDGYEDMLPAIAIECCDLSGQVSVFGRHESGVVGRSWRALRAWFVNRGLRDSWQYLADPSPGPGDGLTGRMKGVFALASHAGEVRTMVYDLKLGSGGGSELTDGAAVLGKKFLVYERRANPLRQMMELWIESFPGADTSSSAARGTHGSVTRLSLDLAYLARSDAPLLKVDEQHDLVTTQMDVLRILAYLARLMISTFSWVFRAPDLPTAAPMRRLPGRLPGVGGFTQYQINVAADDEPAVVTRYENRGSPLVLFHGYSASGTTFAHECLSPAFVTYMWNLGWDVWVVDFRTSPGLTSAIKPYCFEEIAEHDIPTVMAHIADETGKRIHLVAHCMGAAMFSMSVLGGHLRSDLVERAVLTQVGPGVVFSAANVFRGYALAVLKDYLPLDRYDFRVGRADGLGLQMLDRLLNLLPYPESEYDIENPPWPPWRRTPFVGTRHRMDALYGRDFSLANVSDSFLHDIDAMFGPLNLETVSQVIHLARWKNVTDRRGRNRYFHRSRLRRYWTFPTMSIHGAENGLSSPATLARNREMFDAAGCHYETCLVDGFGHQDIWVSPRSETEVFPRIAGFLSRTDSVDHRPERGTSVGDSLLIKAPFLGPFTTLPDGNGQISIRLGQSPNLPAPRAVLLVPADVARETARADIAVDMRISWDEPDWDRNLVWIEPEDFALDNFGMLTVTAAVSPGESVFVLLVYEEDDELTEVTFGDT